MHKKLSRIFLITALLAAPLMLTAGEAEQRAANELLEVMQCKKQMDETINSMTQIMQQTNPEMVKYNEILITFFNTFVHTDNFYNEIIDLYANTFTEQELKDMIAFYQTPTGQKTLKALPDLTMRAMQLGQKYTMQNMDKLEKMIQEAQQCATE